MDVNPRPRRSRGGRHPAQRPDRGGRDRPADHEQIRSPGDRLARREHPALIADRAPRRPHAGCHQHESLPEAGAQRLDLGRRANDAIEPALLGERGQALCAHVDRAREADLLELVGGVAGEHRDPDHEWPRPGAERVPCRAQHGASAEAVHRHHPRAEPGRLPAGGGDGVGDVVKLEIEEHVETAPHKRLDEGRTRGAEKLEAHFQAAPSGRDPVDEREGRVGRGIVERHGDRGRRSITPPAPA